jgi:2-C-methyl-D-erythritol 2,4-cyclodiphosphate synthase
VTDLRIGIGVDAHALAEGVPLVLGCVEVDHPLGLVGHSDGDVIAHALVDALLGALRLGDIGALFPSVEPALEGIDSGDMLRRAYELVREQGYELVNANCVLVGEEPRVSGLRTRMEEALAAVLGVEPGRIAVSATTTDRLGFTGRGEGLAAHAVALLQRG